MPGVEGRLWSWKGVIAMCFNHWNHCTCQDGCWLVDGFHAYNSEPFGWLKRRIPILIEKMNTVLLGCQKDAKIIEPYTSSKYVVIVFFLMFSYTNFVFLLPHGSHTHYMHPAFEEGARLTYQTVAPFLTKIRDEILRLKPTAILCTSQGGAYLAAGHC